MSGLGLGFLQSWCCQFKLQYIAQYCYTMSIEVDGGDSTLTKRQFHCKGKVELVESAKI
jgi:hypothetical protein